MKYEVIIGVRKLNETNDILLCGKVGETVKGEIAIEVALLVTELIGELFEEFKKEMAKKRRRKKVKNI